MTQQQPPFGSPPSRNGLGLAGLIISVVGTILCGTLAPLGLLLSAIALRKRPRGFAIAGTVVGAIGTLLLVWVVLGGMVIVKAMLGFADAAASGITFTTLVQARDAVAAEKAAAGKLPDDANAASIVSQYKDAWTRPLHYQRMGDTYRIVSDGADATSGTVDDLFLSETDPDPTVTPR